MSAPGGGEMHQPLPGCFRHPDRPTGLRCSRCGRPACHECLRQAPVGFHCVDCIEQERRGAAARMPTATAGNAAGSLRATLAARPTVTYVLIGLNVLAYLITAVQAGSVLDNNRGSDLYERFALVPGLVANGEWWRLIGSGFLHFGIIHLAVNMYALYVVGIACENALGKLRYSLVYLVGLLGGSAAVMFGAWNGQTAGASGAIFGLFGAVLIILLRLRRNPNMMIAVIVINVIISVSVPGISWLGHLGGFLAGTAATAAIVYAPEALRALGVHQPTRKAVFGAGFGVLGALFVVEIVLIAVQVTSIQDQYALILPHLRF
ncbi:rhomboid family intramembrane serine protease [Tomitella fengzijianii]|uniref:Rhomboid family intramembrane serine protease n=1 Tax=Tomitella fengzijianii TaxID=2597660 RepID=A0A516WZ23_9ACTN|nr:rhomboid family intramembrane serine protease [Tomitella fengzijianii]QDQ96096.1 rhomboid family intramembrane serine protease [Tomitella fengzijianii]